MSDVGACARQREDSGTASFSRAARLRKPDEFKRVFSKPLVSRDHCFKVLARINDLNRSRLGMAVSRRVDKRAVVRNRLKRVIRESFRQAFGATTENRTPSIDIVVLPSQNAATICNKALFRSLDKHWSRLDDRLR